MTDHLHSLNIIWKHKKFSVSYSLGQSELSQKLVIPLIIIFEILIVIIVLVLI